MVIDGGFLNFSQVDEQNTAVFFNDFWGHRMNCQTCRAPMRNSDLFCGRCGETVDGLLLIERELSDKMAYYRRKTEGEKGTDRDRLMVRRWERMNAAWSKLMREAKARN